MLPDETPPLHPLTPSDMFAKHPNNYCNSGPDQCHWCGCPCERLIAHDDEPRMLFAKSPLLARRPSSGYICRGCEIYRRKRTTITYLDGSFSDGKCLINYSWWIDQDGPKVIDKQRWTKDGVNLFREKLINPPNSFCFSLLTDAGRFSKEKANHLQLCKANDLCVIKADTILYYTFDNQVYNYTVYELKEALKHGPEGREPGVRLLVDLIGMDEQDVIKRNGGRPAGTAGWEKSPKTLVAASGNPSI